MRNRIEVWMVRARALLAVGQTEAGLRWADKAVSAADEYCVPGSKYPRLSHALRDRFGATPAR